MPGNSVFAELWPDDLRAYRREATTVRLAGETAEHSASKERARRLYAIVALEGRLFPPAKLADLLGVHTATLYRWRNEIRDSDDLDKAELRRRIGMNR